MLLRSETSAADDAQATTALLELGWNGEDREDNWPISYADLLSVLFAMVVLLFGRMFAMAAVAPAIASSPIAADLEPAAVVAATPSNALVTRADAEAEREDRLAALVDQRFSGRIETRRRERGLTLAIPAVALFTSARADLQPAALPLLTELAATLREVGDARIAVEGHTDDQPVLGGAFDSNWDLAAGRANAVTRFLLEQGFAPARLQSVSFADTHPVADNSTADGRAANRRVELQIELAADTR